MSGMTLSEWFHLSDSWEWGRSKPLGRHFPALSFLLNPSYHTLSVSLYWSWSTYWASDLIILVFIFSLQASSTTEYIHTSRWHGRDKRWCGGDRHILICPVILPFAMWLGASFCSRRRVDSSASAVWVWPCDLLSPVKYSRREGVLVSNPGAKGAYVFLFTLQHLCHGYEKRIPELG